MPLGCVLVEAQSAPVVSQIQNFLPADQLQASVESEGCGLAHAGRVERDDRTQLEGLVLRCCDDVEERLRVQN